MARDEEKMGLKLGRTDHVESVPITQSAHVMVESCRVLMPRRTHVGVHPGAWPISAVQCIAKLRGPAFPHERPAEALRQNQASAIESRRDPNGAEGAQGKGAAGRNAAAHTLWQGLCDGEAEKGTRGRTAAV